MQILFVHNNFPAQFRGLAGELAKSPDHRVVAIGSETAQDLPGVELLRYRMPFFNVSQTHPFARRLDVEGRRATQVLFALSELQAKGFTPDLIVGHCGWGETLPLRPFFPKAKIAIYCEFYYRPEGQDIHFDPDDPQFGVDGIVAIHCKNAATLLSLVDADLGLSPTSWQKQTYPSEFHPKIHVVHEGVDDARLMPDANAQFELPGGRVLHRGDEIVTFVARNLEPMRGYHVFMRALPDILAARPNAQAVIIGGDDVSYGAAPEQGKSWKSIYLDEVADRLDLSRVHFLPPQPYDRFVQLLQTTTVHVYFTVPFVLSWSMIEAMALGCVVIGSDTPPVREAIDDGVNGLLTPFHEPAGLAERVSRVLAAPSDYAALGAAARETALARYAKKDCLRQAMDILGLPVPAPDPEAPTDAADAPESPEKRPAPFIVRRSRGASSANQEDVG
ncbi:Glycosyltransferase involved in cell wall bisynthesis [Rhodoblastus acidophilus]|uniref:Glycosyltransferase involved in cell wall bisynthesis n=1 Tax=Rhodoblastus acidophilus TaxID=1074 RepID=A0A212QM34_RHOAC|nr:glycosyltransferase [Rhodoblastus acidophilus]PPQ36188.1 glycosyl transferase family 1 [Rhodoblastus acidophilus]RAI23774.1 glycosyl transferase family 1 [Rhodoblastus acidophilus]SNB60439.1 Glycosyltransferase involved in cell wall bisynthesis [Rhodoblastus acidophilus]